MEWSTQRWTRILTTSHPLIIFKIEKCYESEPKFKDVYQRNNLPNSLRDRAYIVNFGGCKYVEMHLFTCELTYLFTYWIIPNFLKNSGSKQPKFC